MSNIQSVVNSLLARASKVDPVMLTILQEMLNEIDRLGIKIDDPPTVSTKISVAAQSNAPVGPVNLTYTLTENNVFLNWEAGQIDFVYYEVRKGTVWSSATKILVTASFQAILDPLPVGSTTYLVRAIDNSGIYSDDIGTISVVVPSIGGFSITVTQINTNVLIKWTPPSSTFRISYYIVKKDGVEIGRTAGTFFATFETAGGTFVYSITPYDIAGNSGSPISTSVLIPNPTDFIFRAGFSSSFGGTKTNAILDSSSIPTRLLLPINTSETYQAHFTTRSWASPQAQVTAGYTRWLSPSAASATYKETFDCGSIYTSTIISHTYSTNTISGAFTIGLSTRVSDDGISWSSAQTGASIYVTSVRYIEVTVTFTGSNDKALLEFYNFNVAVSVKEEVDSGSVAALSTDALGTVVTFNKAFKDVDSITASVASTKEPYTVVRNFVDIPNPTSFTVFVYDTSGIRVSKTVDWKARGII